MLREHPCPQGWSGSAPWPPQRRWGLKSLVRRIQNTKNRGELTLQGSLVTADDVALVLGPTGGLLLSLDLGVILHLSDDLAGVLLRLLGVTRVADVRLRIRVC